MSETLTKRGMYDRLSTLMEEQRKIMAKLDRSLRIETLWPKAFAAQMKCTMSLVGSPSTGYELVLMREDGASKRWPAHERVLGRELLREQIDKLRAEGTMGNSSHALALAMERQLKR